MNRTKIEWCDSTWNPVTGCFNDCEYCYARRIANRFSYTKDWTAYPGNLELKEPVVDELSGRVQAYPRGFAPTFHRYRLDEPQKWKKGRNIFVCSMADLFGDWVPTRWILEVLDACKMAPQHRYMFLTKNPARYIELDKMALLPHGNNFWYGSTVPDEAAQAMYPKVEEIKAFWSMEPLLGPVDIRKSKGLPQWIILGDMTGPGSAQRHTKMEWVDDILFDAGYMGIPVFMKDSLIPIAGEENMVREFPWEETGRREH